MNELFSIITVSYNEEEGIKRTLESVLNQTFQNYQYIVIDGKSSDCTYKIEEEYLPKFQKKGINCHFQTESDKGIYDAMNKGIDFATGQYLLFLNAGDSFFNSAVLKDVFNYIDNKYDIVYGSTINKAFGLQKLEKPLELSQIKEHSIFCHQSAFIKNEVIKEYKYSLKYRYASDYGFFLKCYCNNKSFRKIPVIISCFEIGGASTKGDITILYEKNDIQKELAVISDSEYQLEKNRLDSLKKKLVKTNKIKGALPRWLLKRIYINKYKKNGYEPSRE